MYWARVRRFGRVLTESCCFALGESFRRVLGNSCCFCFVIMFSAIFRPLKPCLSELSTFEDFFKN